ncbi:hypothetical protein VTL71DRAFT_10204 [Oculimacula yallundae]|uniref:Protein kinase domain-containing protein n=1 Tax=Oculimacula yallundae TaxID=86028 RepID=A0ABR4BQ34_9HELO
MERWNQDNNRELAAYRDIVDQYTRTAACGRKYVLINSLTHWMKSRVQPESPATQASRLLEAVYRPHSFPGNPTTPEQLEDCMIVFCVLLCLGKGDLIHHFRRYHVHDRALPIPQPTLKTAISKMDLTANPELESAFNEAQWRFCPVKFKLYMDEECPPDSIVPICRKSMINNKGGTSAVWVVDVYEEFVTPRLRQQLSSSKYRPPEEPSRWRYKFALKTFKEGWRSTFDNEKKAFQGLRDHQGMVKYLGDYSHPGHRESDAPSVIITTHNILLEYGEMDLQQFFVERAPPILKFEIEAFWKDISDVATALKGIHNLRTRKYEGYEEEYHGWHADIKPDNILIVQGQFKLADPGFSTFVRAKKGDPDPKTVLLGGTITYAAPECRNDKTRYSISAVPQTIDTWSLGCVLSVAASWVVLDEQGIKQFRTIRQNAIRRINEEKSQSEHSPRRDGLESVMGDYFHDGQVVLEDVTNWHKFLRLMAKRTDTITGRILDLVDDGMLVADPGKRMKAKDVCIELSQIMKDSCACTPDDIPPSILSALVEMDKEATFSVDTSGPLVTNSLENQALTISDKRQAANSRLLDPAIMKTAHRSEYHKSSESTQTASDDHATTRPGDIQLPVLSISVNTQRKRSEYYRFQSQDQEFQPNALLSRQFNLVETRNSKPLRRPTYRNVFQARAEVEKRNDRNRIQALLPFKSKSEDPLLSGYFLTRKRDVKFLVDNGSTMIDSWAEASYLLETLLMKLEGLDKDGMDLTFTLGPIAVQNDRSRASFMKAMRDACPPLDSTHNTDMRQSLKIILDDYLHEVEKRERMKGQAKDLTILVLTDGIWEGTPDKETVDQTIVNFLRDLKKIKGDLSLRPASIEFIQFGDDPNATYKLKQLDDNLLKWKDVDQDIIDTEHCRGDVNKMILGSFVECFDKENDNGEDSSTEQSPSPPPQSSHSMSNSLSPNRHSPMSPIDGRQLSLQSSPESIDYGSSHPSPSRVPPAASGFSRTSHRRSGFFNRDSTH